MQGRVMGLPTLFNTHIKNVNMIDYKSIDKMDKMWYNMWSKCRVGGGVPLDCRV